MSSDTLQRNTIFALVIAVEQDLRNVFATHLKGTPTPLQPDDMQTVIERAPKDTALDSTAHWTEFLDYFDLSQTLTVLSQYDSVLAAALGTSREAIKKLVRHLTALMPIRNRVCHGRPLELDDLVMTLERVKVLRSGEFAFIRFVELEDVMLKLSADSNYPLTISIPQYWQNDLKVVINNLPVPDYADTGFVGREADRENLMKLLLGSHSLITVTGEGGVGKTSLTLRCLQDLIHQVGLYDYVIWTSLKTTHLTPSGVREIADALTNEVQLLKEITDILGEPISGGEKEELFSAVREILDAVRVLLIIDNLETIDRDALRPLLIDIPRKSKIVLTSRIGIGEIEVRYQLNPMTDKDAVDLLRRTARLMNVADLVKRDNKEVAQICEQLFFNPLAIRWFVQSYAAGRSIQNLLKHPKSLDAVMDFCFENLYDSLSEEQRKYLRTLVSVGKPLSEVQLALLTKSDDIEKIRADLRYLASSNLLRKLRDEWSGGQSELWSTTEFARKFIVSRDKQLSSMLGLRADHKKLISARDAARAEAATNPFNNRVIDARTTDETMVVSTLKEALRESVRTNYTKAINLTERAKKLLPDFYEIWRISAYIKARGGDPLGAQVDYEKAIILANGKSPALYVRYAEFLKNQDEFEHAIELLEEPAASATAPPQLIATLAWLKVLNREWSDSIELFERAYSGIKALGGDERTQFATQFVEALHRAARYELERQLPEEALKHLVRAFEIMRQATNEAWLDDRLIQVGQDCFLQACRMIAMRCSVPMWEQLQPILTELSQYFDLLSHDSQFRRAAKLHCPEIYERDDFQRLIPEHLKQEISHTENKARQFGVVIKLNTKKGWGFIRGKDGRDYFFHNSEILNDSWENFCKLDHPQVQFVSSPAPGTGKSPQALSIEVLDI